MNLTSVKIKNFRNISDLELKFGDWINYIYSPNGTGKTNFLEALQCITLGKSTRAKSEIDLLPFAGEVKGLLVRGQFLDEEGLDSSQSFVLEKSPKKKKTLYINKTKTSINTFLGTVPSIWFSPESIKIIDTSPRNKRKYFDDILIQLYPKYHEHLRNYNKALRHRNKILQSPTLNPNMVRVWSEQLITHGAAVLRQRIEFFRVLNEAFDRLNEINRYRFNIEFLPNLKISEIFNEDIENRFREELRATFALDKMRGATHVGIHKDDWKMLINIEGQNDDVFIQADKFASRGQQRMALIMLQMVLIELFQSITHKKPILLLDDIFSELDEENEHILIDYIKEHKIQSFITGVWEKKFPDIFEVNLKENMLH